MKLFKLCLFLFIIAGWQKLPAQDKATAHEVIEQMKSQLTCTWNDETVDTFKSGNPDDVVTGIAVSMFADMPTLRKAVENNCNLIIVHEPTFYNHLDKTDFLENDPVYEKKIAYINEHKLIIFRFHDHWHRTSPDGIYMGMIDKLGWKDNQYNNSLWYFQFKDQSVAEFAKQLQEKLKGSQLRIVGDPKMHFTNVALSVGASGSQNHIHFLEDGFPELLIAGEAPEWETYEYVLDASNLGMKKAAIFTGHIVSEDAGMDYCAKWLKTFIKDLSITYFDNGSSFWSVK
jgi:putative NIF3 family GTP cyclohydrolase 1 type 2